MVLDVKKTCSGHEKVVKREWLQAGASLAYYECICLPIAKPQIWKLKPKKKKNKERKRILALE